MSYAIRRWNGSRQSPSLQKELARLKEENVYIEEEIIKKDKEIKELKKNA